MRYVYDNTPGLKKVLSERPDLRWDGVFRKLDYEENPYRLPAMRDMQQYAVINVSDSESGHWGNPLDAEEHCKRVSLNAVTAIYSGQDGVLFDFELYSAGRLENRRWLMTMTPQELARLRHMWRNTASIIKGMGRHLKFGGTGCLTMDYNPIYEAIVAGVNDAGMQWLELTQSTHKGGNNELVDEMKRKYVYSRWRGTTWRVQWIDMILCSHPTVADHFPKPDRWPRGSDWCANTATTMLKREAEEFGFIAKMWEAGQ